MRISFYIRFFLILLTILLFIFLFFFIKKNETKNYTNIYFHKKKITKKLKEKKTFKKVKSFHKRIGPIYVNKYDILRFRRDEPYIFLTFDGCSLNNCVKPILRILKDKKVPATFFLNGRFIENFPFDTKLISNSPLIEVGSHLYRHVHLTNWEKLHRQITKKSITKDFFLSLLKKNELLYYNLTGKKMGKIWRAPYGETNFQLDTWAHELGYYHISWTRDYKYKENLDTIDWLYDKSDKRYRTNLEILNMLLNFGKHRKYGFNGGIVLFHLGSKRKEPVYEILPSFIDKMRKRGYVFKNVSFGIKELNK